LRGEKTGVGGACPGGHCQELTMWVWSIVFLYI
jgi:hypothetical protein